MAPIVGCAPISVPGITVVMSWFICKRRIIAALPASWGGYEDQIRYEYKLSWKLCCEVLNKYMKTSILKLSRSCPRWVIEMSEQMFSELDCSVIRSYPLVSSTGWLHPPSSPPPAPPPPPQQKKYTHKGEGKSWGKTTEVPAPELWWGQKRTTKPLSAEYGKQREPRVEKVGNGHDCVARPAYAVWYV